MDQLWYRIGHSREDRVFGARQGPLSFANASLRSSAPVQPQGLPMKCRSRSIMHPLTRLLLFASALAPMPLRAAEPDQSVIVSRVTIRQYGLTDFKRGRQVPAPGATSGWQYATTLSQKPEYRTTTKVPARMNVCFGITYQVDAFPSNTYLQMDHIIIHPPMRNPETGVVSGIERYRSGAILAGAALGCTFRFDHPWEIVPGTWTFQISYQGKVYAEKSFEVGDWPE